MSAVAIIFPHQLFQYHPALRENRKVYLVEEWLFFQQYQFHKLKLVHHRASMQAYAAWLTSKGFDLTYIESNKTYADSRNLAAFLKKEGVTTIHVAELVDNWLSLRLNRAAKKAGIHVIIHQTPGFLNSLPEADTFFNKRKTYFQTDFYVAQRKQRNLLLETNGKPIGGKWTFDSENRLRIPKDESIPVVNLPSTNQHVKEAIKYVQRNFPANYGNDKLTIKGEASESFYPVTHKEALQWLQQFLKKRFACFGPYEDAMVPEEHFLFHSVLTPVLNTGLLCPQEVIDASLDYAAHHEIPINSLEGFLRQITGWREFIRIVYEREGTKQRTTNYWNFHRTIPAAFWQGETGIAPVDMVIKKLLDTGYSHHIERLMVLGNFFLLCEFHPDEVYRWFMELYIDSYDWVMVPNVYGMTQFADGGLMTTKPYISGSNYLMKMGNWPKGDWQDVWDGLFWRFMDKHRKFFLTNPRLGMLVNTFDKMSAEKRKKHLAYANNFLKQIDKWPRR